MRRRRNTAWLAGAGVGLFIAVVVLLTLGNLSYARQNPGGNDFLVHWIGTRSYLIDGLSPYSDETALRIQTAAYGGPAKPGQHELRVAYPFYSIIVFFPFAVFPDFNLARAVWMTFLEVCLVLMAILCVRLAGWRPNLVSLAVYLLFALVWYHAARPLINGNAVILVALLVTGALLAIKSGADELAGVLLAFSTIKPQVVVVLIAFIVLWALYKRRWRLLAWLFGTTIILSAAAAFLIPDWILQNLREIMRYPGYNPPGTPGTALATWFPATGERLGQAFTVITLGLTVFEWLVGRNASFRGFLWMACLTLVASQWIGIQTDPGNFIIAFPALTLVFALLDERWRHRGWVLSTLIMLSLLVGLWALFLNTVQYLDQPIQSPIMFFALPAVLFFLLYWVRWSAFHEGRAWFDLISQEQRRL